VNTEPEKKPLEFEFIHHDDIGDSEGAFDFVEDVFTDGASSVVYGAPGDGKTFFMLDLGAHVATGHEWQGKEVEKGAVLYIALEGKKGAENRIKAMKRRGILPDGAPFFLCYSSVNLLHPDHPEAIKRLIENVSERAGILVRLVIIDTMARAMAGGDENSGKDMTAAVETIDAARKATGAHINVVHHSGKDTERGGRGHSSLKGAIDTEIQITCNDCGIIRTATVKKQRDLEKIPPLCFSLEVVEVGFNRRGKVMTSCVVKAVDGIMAQAKGKVGAPPKYNPQMLLDLLPQPTIKSWQAESKRVHSMGKDAFDDHKGKCASQWEKTHRGVIRKDLESLLDIENRGNGGN
jgi:hypothetical protein